MANSKVSTLTAASALDGTELYYGVQSGSDAKITGAQIRTLASGTTVTVNISSAQFLVLGSSPPVIVAAPGVGNAVIPLSCFIQFTANSLIYDSATGGIVDIGYAGINRNIIETNVGLGTDQTQFWHHAIRAPTASAVGEPFSDIANKSIILKGNSMVAGPIVTSTLGAGGSGYAVGDTGMLPDHSGDATYVVDSISGGGGTGPVATYHLSNVGTGYFVENGVATQVSTGAGNGSFTINVTSVLQGNGTAKVTLTYEIAALPA